MTNLTPLIRTVGRIKKKKKKKRKALTCIQYTDCIGVYLIVKTLVVQTIIVKNATDDVSLCYVGRRREEPAVDGVCFFER